MGVGGNFGGSINAQGNGAGGGGAQAVSGGVAGGAGTAGKFVVREYK
jgi:hypothetical protein